MSEQSIKVTFTLDASDVRYFRHLYQHAKKAAKGCDAQSVLAAAKALVETVRKVKRLPAFVEEAVENLDTLICMLNDPHYTVSKNVREQVVAALAYFSNPHDLIPDNIPAFGFLDDAIMIKFVEDELKHDIWAYRKFCEFRRGAEQRPWTKVASSRLPQRLADYEAKLQIKVKERKVAENRRRKALKALGW